MDNDSGYGTPSPVPTAVLPVNFQSPVLPSVSTPVPKRSLLDKDAVSILNAWYQENHQCPYPCNDTIADLSGQTKLTPEQIKSWFSNRRNRSSRQHHQDHSCKNHVLTPSGKCQSKRQANNLPLSSEAIKIMNTWYRENIHCPYIDDAALASLVEQTKLNAGQVRKWFANRRMRSKNTYKQTGAMNALKYYGMKRQQQKQQQEIQQKFEKEYLSELSNIRIDSVCSLVVNTKTES